MLNKSAPHIAHAEAAGKIYQERRHAYNRFSETLKSVLETCLANLPIHVVEGRAKTVESFIKKASKADRSNPESPRYPDPLNEITDLAGIRIITYFPEAIGLVEDVLKRELVVIERTDKSMAFEVSGKLGYQSVHYLIKLGAARLPLPEYAPFADLVAEVQVRTILQHAWAEMEHDIQYKSEDQIPTELRRRFASLAGLIEIADREFQAIQDSDAELRKQIRASLDLPNIEGRNANPMLITSADSSASSYQAGLARYEAMIEKEPNQFANYLGRAKIRFLMGDRTGALEDLNFAETIAPGHEHIAAVRRKIDQGLIASSAINDSVRKLLSTGVAKLGSGNGDGALADFDAACSLSGDIVFVNLDRSLALCLLGRLDDALVELDKLTPRPGSFLAAEVAACKCMIESWKNQRAMEIDELEIALVGLAREFDLTFSVLRHLQTGLQIASPIRYEIVEHIFKRLMPEKTSEEL